MQQVVCKCWDRKSQSPGSLLGLDNESIFRNPLSQPSGSLVSSSQLLPCNALLLILYDLLALDSQWWNMDGQLLPHSAKSASRHQYVSVNLWCQHSQAWFGWKLYTFHICTEMYLFSLPIQVYFYTCIIDNYNMGCPPHGWQTMHDDIMYMDNRTAELELVVFK